MSEISTNIRASTIYVTNKKHRGNNAIISGTDLGTLEIAAANDPSNPITKLTERGIVIPHVTTEQRLSITEQEEGQLFYDTDADSLFIWNGNWVPIFEEPNTERLVPLFVDNLATIRTEIEGRMITEIPSDGGGFVPTTIPSYFVPPNPANPTESIKFENQNIASAIVLQYEWLTNASTVSELSKNMDVYVVDFEGQFSTTQSTICTIGWKNDDGTFIEFEIQPTTSTTVFGINVRTNVYGGSIDDDVSPGAVASQNAVVTLNVKFVMDDDYWSVLYKLGGLVWVVALRAEKPVGFDFSPTQILDSDMNPYWKILTEANVQTQFTDPPLVVTHHKLYGFMKSPGLIWDNFTSTLRYCNMSYNYDTSNEPIYDPAVVKQWKDISFGTAEYINKNTV
jgi:hypothetical protein